MSIGQAAIDLAVAVSLGAAIGFERQWRNRLAGLRTNALVALGSATFVVFEALAPGDSSPTRVAAQVVSGIGFIGAGLIFREGLSVRGLNTAATLWCSAAIGRVGRRRILRLRRARDRFRGVREPVVAADRPLHQPPAAEFDRARSRLSRVGDLPQSGRSAYSCAPPAHARLCGAGAPKSSDLNGTGRVAVTAILTAAHRIDAEVEKIVGRLSLEQTISAARWRRQ